MNRLIIGVMYGSLEKFNLVLKDLVGLYGSVLISMKEYDFTKFTKFYIEEMGAVIFKKMIVFEKEVSKKDLVKIKEDTTKLEEKYSVDGKRKINLDPGFISSEKMVLASFKKGTGYKEKISDEVYLHTVLKFKPLEEFQHTFFDYKQKKEEFLELSKSLT